MIWRVLAGLAGLALGALWFVGSGLALGLRECPLENPSGLCAESHENLLAALEIAVVLGGTLVAVAGGALSARSGRPHWLVGALVVLGVLSFCGDLVSAGQELPPG